MRQKNMAQAFYTHLFRKIDLDLADKCTSNQIIFTMFTTGAMTKLTFSSTTRTIYFSLKKSGKNGLNGAKFCVTALCQMIFISCYWPGMKVAIR